MPRTTQPMQGTLFRAKGIFRFPVAYLLCALVLMMIGSPFGNQFRGGTLVEAVLMTLVLLSAVLALGGRLRTLIGAVLAMSALFRRMVKLLAARSAGLPCNRPAVSRVCCGPIPALHRPCTQSRF